MQDALFTLAGVVIGSIVMLMGMAVGRNADRQDRRDGR